MWAAQRGGYRSHDPGTVKPEPGQQEPEIMAGCGEDDVDRITARTLEGVALHQAVAF